jgi:hypothetical protein
LIDLNFLFATNFLGNRPHPYLTKSIGLIADPNA